MIAVSFELFIIRECGQAASIFYSVVKTLGRTQELAVIFFV
jgi:hypothetical protein